MKKTGAPKLQASRVPDSSTDDIEGEEAIPIRSRRPTRNRRSPSNKAVHNGSKVRHSNN